MQRKWELQLSGVDFGKTIHESTTTITNSQDVNKKVIDSQEILQVCQIFRESWESLASKPSFLPTEPHGLRYFTPSQSFLWSFL